MTDTILTISCSALVMKAQFEKVTVAPGESWTLLWRELSELPFLWHYHPEFELTLTLNARGQRYVGDSLEGFEPGDLVLLGPNQPHTWAASERLDESQPMLAVVVWFTSEWLSRLVEGWPELRSLRRLSEEAGRGIHFGRDIVAKVQPLMLCLKELDPARRLPVLLQVLTCLADAPSAKKLATHAFAPAGDKVQGRMTRVLDLLHADMVDTPSIQRLADEAALSIGAFHRFFKRHTGMTALDYVSQLRIGTACQLLISTDRPVKIVAAEAGYANVAHFNRQFLERKQMTPREFRVRHRTGSAQSTIG